MPPFRATKADVLNIVAYVRHAAPPTYNYATRAQETTAHRLSEECRSAKRPMGDVR